MRSPPRSDSRRHLHCSIAAGRLTMHVGDGKIPAVVGVSSNGRTPDSGSGSWGSNPCSPAKTNGPLALGLAVRSLCPLCLGGASFPTLSYVRKLIVKYVFKEAYAPRPSI